MQSLITDLHLTISNCIQLKTYAISKGSEPNPHIHPEAIAFSMSDEYILHPLDDHTDLSDYFYLYCICGYFIVLLIMLNIFMSTHLHESIVKSFVNENNIEIASSTIVIGALLMFCEFVSVSVSIDSSFMKLRFYVRIPTVLFFPLFICLLIYSIKCYSKSERKEIIGACTGCYL